MSKAQLYFLSDEYFKDFPDNKLMRNKEKSDGVSRKRPFFFAFRDTSVSEIYWLVPVSSKYEKYKLIEQEKLKKNGMCNTIRFGTILGRNAVFLIQNMCPTTEKYLTPYLDRKGQPVLISSHVAADVERNARFVLALTKRGAKLIFPDSLAIFRTLRQQLKNELAQQVEQVGQAKQVGQDENKIRKERLTPADEEVLARIRQSKSGTKFDMLYNGKIKGEKADVQLMFALAFFTKSDRSQMERIYKSSALYDPSKLDGYIKKTISIAIDNLNKKTSPQKPSSKNRDKGK